MKQNLPPDHVDKLAELLLDYYSKDKISYNKGKIIYHISEEEKLDIFLKTKIFIERHVISMLRWFAYNVTGLVETEKLMKQIRDIQSNKYKEKVEEISDIITCEILNGGCSCNKDLCERKHNIWAWLNNKDRIGLHTFLIEGICGWRRNKKVKNPHRYKSIQEGLLYIQIVEFEELPLDAENILKRKFPCHDKEADHHIITCSECGERFNSKIMKLIVKDQWIIHRDFYSEIKMYRCHGQNDKCDNHFDNNEGCPLKKCDYKLKEQTRPRMATVYIYNPDANKKEFLSSTEESSKENKKELISYIHLMMEEFPWIWCMMLCIKEKGNTGPDIIRGVIDGDYKTSEDEMISIIDLFSDRTVNIPKNEMKEYRNYLLRHRLVLEKEMGKDVSKNFGEISIINNDFKNLKNFIKNFVRKKREVL